MVVGVVAYGVSARDYLLYQLGIYLGIVAQAEEGRFGTIVVQNIEYLLGNFGRRTVVESQIDTLLTLDSPQHCGHHLPYEFRKMEIHFWGVIPLCDTKV